MKKTLLAIVGVLIAIGLPVLAEIVGGNARSTAKFDKPSKLAVSRLYDLNCGPRDTVERNLGEKYSEQVVWEGNANGKYAAELWQSPDTWTWSVTDENGVACIIASGKRDAVD